MEPRLEAPDNNESANGRDGMLKKESTSHTHRFRASQPKTEDTGLLIEKGNPEKIFRWFINLPKDEELADILDGTVKEMRARLRLRFTT